MRNLAQQLSSQKGWSPEASALVLGKPPEVGTGMVRRPRRSETPGSVEVYGNLAVDRNLLNIRFGVGEHPLNIT